MMSMLSDSFARNRHIPASGFLTLARPPRADGDGWAPAVPTSLSFLKCKRACAARLGGDFARLRRSCASETGR
jgi:hypothetical protein